MRISWGYKIFFFYLSFVIGMLFLVYKANSESFDLVTENYYEAELKYQDLIDQKTNVSQLSGPPKITHTVKSIAIQLPKEFNGKAVQGNIYLYRPSDATKDLQKSFATSEGFIAFELDKELSGAYSIKLSWEANGLHFFQEQKLFF